jgi:hypothetical protein
MTTTGAYRFDSESVCRRSVCGARARCDCSSSPAANTAWQVGRRCATASKKSITDKSHPLTCRQNSEWMRTESLSRGHCASHCVANVSPREKTRECPEARECSSILFTVSLLGVCGSQEVLWLHNIRERRMSSGRESPNPEIRRTMYPTRQSQRLTHTAIPGSLQAQFANWDGAMTRVYREENIRCRQIEFGFSSFACAAA